MGDNIGAGEVGEWREGIVLMGVKVEFRCTC